MGKQDFAYTGCENLEVMSDAKNYNQFLINFVTSAAKKTGKKKLKVLDFGAGSGTYTDMLREHHGIKPDCLEPDKKLQKVLKLKGYTTLSNMLELKKGQYDIIYALNVFEHIEDDHATLEELAKSLKKGGHIIIYVPAFQILFTAMDEKVGHYRRYRRNRLADMSKQAGLKIVKLHYCDPLGFGATLAYKVVGKKDGSISKNALKVYDRAIFPLSKASQSITKSAFGKNVVLVAEK